MKKQTAILLAIIAAALAAACWFLFGYLNPKARLMGRFEQMIAAYEKGNLKSVAEGVAEDYRDAYGQDKGALIDHLAQARRHFFWMEVVPSEVKVQVTGREGIIACRVRLEGNGSALAQRGMEQVNALKSDFLFAWRRESWKPSDWKFTRVENPAFAPIFQAPAFD